jgi:HK97 family phage prohead protease
VLPTGAILGRYMENPILLWQHGMSDNGSIPIGRAENLTIGESTIVADFVFADDPFAQRIFNLYEGGFLRGFSIGFVPFEAEKRDDGSVDITSWELMEISGVAIPSNPDALARYALNNKDTEELLSEYRNTDFKESYSLFRLYNNLKNIGTRIEDISNWKRHCEKENKEFPDVFEEIKEIIEKCSNLAEVKMEEVIEINIEAMNTSVVSEEERTIESDDAVKETSSSMEEETNEVIETEDCIDIREDETIKKLIESLNNGIIIFKQENKNLIGRL